MHRAHAGFGARSPSDGHPAAARACLKERTAMNPRWTALRRVALGASLALVLAGCASSPSSPPPDIAQRIAAAQTRAEHESLAAYFTQEATRAREAAALHRKMATSYQARPVGERGSASMVAHCNALAQSYQNSVALYEDMAASHRQMATQAKP